MSNNTTIKKIAPPTKEEVRTNVKTALDLSIEAKEFPTLNDEQYSAVVDILTVTFMMGYQLGGLEALAMVMQDMQEVENRDKALLSKTGGTA